MIGLCMEETESDHDTWYSTTTAARPMKSGSTRDFSVSLPAYSLMGGKNRSIKVPEYVAMLCVIITYTIILEL